MAKAVVTQGRVHMLDESGQPVTVPEAELQQAYAAGFSLDTPEGVQQRQIQRERGTLGQQAVTGLEAAARGATLGLSDVAAREALGEDYTQAALERQQVNPFTAGAGEVAGAILPVLASGGSSAAARGAAALGTPARLVARGGGMVERGVQAGLKSLGYTGERVGSRMLAKAASMGAAGAAEGLAYGAGKGLSDAVLRGDEITAEKVWSSAAEGGKLGGVAGGALGGLSGGLGGLLSRLASARKVRAGLEQTAEVSALKTIGAQGSDIRRMPLPLQVGREVLEYEFKTGPKAGQKLFRVATKAEDLVDDIAHARRETGAQIGAIRQRVDEVGRANRELLPDVDEYLRRVETEVLEPLKESNVPGIRARARKVEAQLQGLRAAERAPGAVRSLDDWADELSSAGIDVEGDAEFAARSAKQLFGEAAPSAEKMKQLFELPEGYTAKVRVAPGYKSAEVWFDITGPAGGHAGSGMRKFARYYDDGQLRVIHDHLYLQPGAQGKGIGSRLMANAKTVYPELGVSGVRIPRAAEVGRYAWARQGAELSPGDLREMQGEFLHFAMFKGEFVDTTEMTLKDIADHPLGKEFLTTSAPKYDATIPITPSPTPSRVAQGERRMSFAELEETRKDLRRVFQPEKPAGGGLPPAVPEHAAHLEQAERILDKYLDESVEMALRKTGDDFGQYLALQKQYRNLRQADDIATKAAGQQLGRRTISPSDYMTGIGAGLGAVLSGNVGALGMGAAAAVAHKLVRERGRSVLATMADRASKLDLRLDDAAKRLAGVKTGAKLAPVKTLTLGVGDYEVLAESVGEAAGAPTVMAEALQQSTAGLEDEPVTPGLHSLIQGDIQYLAERLPRGATRAGASLTAIAETPRVSASAKKEWLEVVQALSDPPALIDRLESGDIPRRGLDALKARRPAMWQDLRERIMRETAERDEPLPYQRRVLLGLTFDFPADPSMLPDMLVSIQEAHQAAAPPAEPPPKRALPSDAGENMMTTSQRVAAGA